MRVLVVGDHFIPAADFRRAISEVLGDEAEIREVSWAGAGREEQHAAQQVMEKQGPGAVETPPEIVEAVGDAEVIAVHFAPVPEKVLAAGSQLRAVVVARAGIENVDVDAASRLGIEVRNVQGRNANAVAEQAIALMLTEARDIARADAAVKAGGWPEEGNGPVLELHGRTIGVIGFGQVGRRLADRLRGFEPKLLVYDPYVADEEISSRGGEKVEDLSRIFAESDFVVLHARLTEETRAFLGRELFDLMKPTAYFINNARSRMVDYDALYEVLASGAIAGAALDVHEDEPLPADSRWRRLENVTVTPHIAGTTEETFENSVRLVAEAIADLADGGNQPDPRGEG